MAKKTRKALAAKKADAGKTGPKKKASARNLLLVATRKGAWIFHGDAARRSWRADGPHFLGHITHHLVLDPRDGRTLLAAASTGHLGPTIFRSTDLGRSWKEAARPPAFDKTPDGKGRSVNHTFWLTPAHANEPGVWYAGTSPQGLFRSEDGGITWEPFSSVNDDPQYRAWMGSEQDGTPDGPKMHSIIVDPRDPAHLYFAMSSGGVHETLDGGRHWTPLVEGLEVVEGFDAANLTFHDPHCMRMCPGNPDRPYQQNHCGIYRLDRPARRWQLTPPAPPRLDEREIYRHLSRDARHPSDNREVLMRLVDGSEFDEFKPLYGDTLMCGFARINGFPVGVLANRGVLFSESALKAAHFIDLCCKRDVPLLFLADVTGFMVGREAEQGGIAKAGAKFITAMASANVPKYTVITGGSYGAGYLAMCGRAFRPHAMFMWPNGRAAIMGPEQAATTLALVREQILQRSGQTWSDAEREAFKQPIRDEYERFADAYNFAANLWVDGVIDPLETRAALTLLLEAASRTPRQDTRFGVFRM